MTLTARLLAKMKEPDRYSVIGGSIFMFDVHDSETGKVIPVEFQSDARMLRDRLNASHRLASILRMIAEDEGFIKKAIPDEAVKAARMAYAANFTIIYDPNNDIAMRAALSAALLHIAGRE